MQSSIEKSTSCCMRDFLPWRLVCAFKSQSLEYVGNNLKQRRAKQKLRFLVFLWPNFLLPAARNKWPHIQTCPNQCWDKFPPTHPTSCTVPKHHTHFHPLGIRCGRLTKGVQSIPLCWGEVQDSCSHNSATREKLGLECKQTIYTMQNKQQYFSELC